ncbi:phenylacetate--CoA ligase family protein [Flavobacterium sp. ACAM 123]|uniref:phenylacetate--CoA ligase family protein n=1 Tax=Flavobacterium sp. ACAM 123 TaxID=1189620 RepID=UPI0018DAF986|nr:phenylacetate--CoA ligase family protein [Flavobacterium sp. ACAM 123]
MIRKTLSLCYKSIFNSRQLKLYNQIRKRDILDLHENLKYQKEKLFVILQIACENIAFYKQLRLDLVNFSSYENFQKIPCMTKDCIRQQSDSLLNKEYENLTNIFKNTSGGSTGEPIGFYQTKLQAHHGMGNYWFSLFLNKIDINEKSINLWGAQRDMHADKTSFNFKSYFNNVIVLNTFVLSDEIINSYVQRMNSIKPAFIKAYVHSIYEVAKFINKNNIVLEFTPVIHCTTGPLYPEMKMEIKKAFNNAHVYNFYGSREVSAIATEVCNEKGLFVMYDNVFVEILDDNDKPVKKGEEGNIVITTLNNDYMPLIRYKIGDRGIKGDDIEFGTLKLDNVTGRTLGVIHKKDKTRVDGQFFTTLFFNKEGIKNFQIIQKSIDKIEIKIVKAEKFINAELEDALFKIKDELGEIDIDVEFKDKIDLTATGKIMYVYSELNN